MRVGKIVYVYVKWLEHPELQKPAVSYVVGQKSPNFSTFRDIFDHIE
jgi:hypothetical protein